MEISCKTLKNSQVAVVKGRLDALSSPEAERALLELVEQAQGDLLVDMTAVDYVSSAGLRALLATAKKLRARQGELFFCGLQGAVKDVFAISGLDTLFMTFPSEQEAGEHLH